MPTAASRCGARSDVWAVDRVGRNRHSQRSRTRWVACAVVAEDPANLPVRAEDAEQAHSLMWLMNKGLRIAEPSISGAVGAAIGLLGGSPGSVIEGCSRRRSRSSVPGWTNASWGRGRRARVGAVCALGVGGHEILPSGGHVAARWRPTVLPSGGQQNCPR